MAIPHKNPGDAFTFPAAIYNQMADATNRVLGQVPFGDGSRAPNEPKTIYIQNDSGTDAPEGGILIPYESLFSELIMLNEPVLKGRAPIGEFDAFVVLLEPIPDGQIGKAITAGSANVDISIVDAGHLAVRCIIGDVAKLQTSQVGTGKITAKDTPNSRATITFPAEETATKQIITIVAATNPGYGSIFRQPIGGGAWVLMTSNADYVHDDVIGFCIQSSATEYTLLLSGTYSLVGASSYSNYYIGAAASAVSTKPATGPIIRLWQTFEDTASEYHPELVRRIFVETTDPAPGDGHEGDIWLTYTP